MGAGDSKIRGYKLEEDTKQLIAKRAELRSWGLFLSVPFLAARFSIPLRKVAKSEKRKTLMREQYTVSDFEVEA
jgi:hypothetical protein